MIFNPNKRRKIASLIPLTLLSAILLLAGGCDFSMKTGEASPFGSVINALTGGGIENVVLTMELVPYLPGDADKTQFVNLEETKITDRMEKKPEQFSVSTDEYGQFDWFREGKSVPVGTYRLSAEFAEGGYIFSEKTIALAGFYPAAGIILAMPYDAVADASKISIVLLWNDSVAELNAHLSYPTDVSAADLNANSPGAYYTSDAAGDSDYRYGDMDYATAAPGNAPVYTGFSPENGGQDVLGYRSRVYYAKPSTAADASLDTTTGEVTKGTPDFGDTYKISLDIADNDGRGPETVTIRQVPFDVSGVTAFPITGGSPGGECPELSAGYLYNWLGTLEYYIEVNDTAGETFLAEAEPEVYVFGGGTFSPRLTLNDPRDTTGAAILRINCFLEKNTEGVTSVRYFAYPDTRIVIPDGGYGFRKAN